MKCAGCGTEYEGNFCPNCGTPAPEKIVCQWCGTEYIGKFCMNCGRKPQEPIELRCQHLLDRVGNPLNVEQIAGIYLSEHDLRGFFKRCTSYSDSDIDEFSSYIYHNIDGIDYGVFKAAAMKAQIESAAHPAPPKALTSDSPQSAKPLTKHQRIKENRQSGVACCPKCGSTSLSANKKGFGVVKGGIGALAVGALTGGVGTVIGLGAGNLGAKKVWVTCLNCGHRWKL